MKGAYRLVVLAVLAIFISPNIQAQELAPVLDPFTSIVEKSIDSTVDIETTLTVEGGPMYLPSGEMFSCEIRVKNYAALPAVFWKTADGDRKVKFGGSGAFIDKDASILTAAHVIKSENDELEIGGLFGSFKIKILDYEYWVVLRSKNRQYKAEYVGACLGADYALMRARGINPDDYKVLSLGKSSEVKIGDPVIAIGTPYGLSGTVTRGIVSQLHKRIGMNYYEDFIQTDAAINPGNSGGPLLNHKGELIGVNTAAIPGRSIGFAVSMDLIDLEALRKGDVITPWFGAEALIDQFPRRGKYKKPSINDLSFLYDKTGVEDAQSLMTLADLSFYFRDGDPEKPVEFENKWAILHQVEGAHKPKESASPAHKAGLKKGDLIIKVAGVRVKDGMDLRLALRKLPIDGKPVEVRYIRVTDGVAKEEGCQIILEKKL
jgi:S1-C subfamily serine protease